MSLAFLGPAKVVSITSEHVDRAQDEKLTKVHNGILSLYVYVYICVCVGIECFDVFAYFHFPPLPLPYPPYELYSSVIHPFPPFER